MLLTPIWLVSFVGWFLKIAGEEAAAAYKRRKASEKAAAEKAAKDKAAKEERARLEREAIQAVEKAAKAKREFEAKIAALDEATRQLVLARNQADLRGMLAVIPDVDEVYPTEEDPE